MNTDYLSKYMRGGEILGETGGRADQIPAVVDGERPAALSSGEYVITADVVSMLGDGNTKAGAKILDRFVEKIREMKTGNKKPPEGIMDLLQKGDK
jgi:hypothetical protein